MVKNEFKSVFNEKEVTLELWEVTPKIQREAEVVTNKAFQKGITDGLLLAAEIETILESRGFDFDAELRQMTTLNEQIRTSTAQLLSGKKGSQLLSKMEGRALAISIQKLRASQDSVGQARNSLYSRTAERFADAERSSYTLFATIIDPKTTKPFFKSFEDFKENMNCQVVRDALDVMVRRITNGNTNAEARHPENKWLIRYGFMNEKLQLIRPDGRLVDEDYHLIDEEGYFVDENNNKVDKYGNSVDANGELLITADPDAYKN